MSDPIVMSKNRNYAIDMLRALGAFSVIMLHMQYIGYNAKFVRIILLCARWAVPFFFLVSGYFFEQRSKENLDKIFINTLKNLLCIFIIANFIFFPFALKTEYYFLTDILSLKSLLVGDYIHLWFLGSMIFGYTILWLLLSLKIVVLLPIVSIICLSFSLIADPYSVFISYHIDGQFSRFILSIPLISVGYLYSKYEMNAKINFSHSLIILTFGLIMQYVESFFIFYFRKANLFAHEFLLGTFIFAFGLFILSFNLRLKGDNFLSKIGRDYSLLIYLYHPLLILVVFYFIKSTKSLDTNYLIWFNPLTIFFFTLLILVIFAKKLPNVFRILSGKI